MATWRTGIGQRRSLGLRGPGSLRLGDYWPYRAQAGADELQGTQERVVDGDRRVTGGPQDRPGLAVTPGPGVAEPGGGQHVQVSASGPALVTWMAISRSSGLALAVSFSQNSSCGPVPSGPVPLCTSWYLVRLQGPWSPSLSWFFTVIIDPAATSRHRPDGVFTPVAGTPSRRPPPGSRRRSAFVPGLTAGAWERLVPYDSHWGMMTRLLRASMRASQPAASRGRYQAAGIAEPGQVNRLDQRGY